MPSPKTFLRLVIRGVAVPSLGILLAAVPAIAQSNSGDYAFLIASGFLCESGDSSACPAVVRSADGASYGLSGVGTFNTKSKLVTATGTFTHKSPSGNSLETGIWMASEFVSFDSSTDGISLTFEGGGGEFDQEPSGRTMFILPKLAAVAAPKPSATVNQTIPQPVPVQQ